MNKLAVIYWSGTGNTQAMAEAVADGAKAAGADASLLTCAEVSGADAYDAVALGCPAMGAEELEDSEFLPMLESIEPALPGKKVALFGSYGWGDGTGLYVAYSNLEGEAEAAPYTLTESGDGQTVLTLTADDGTISWVKQDK